LRVSIETAAPPEARNPDDGVERVVSSRLPTRFRRVKVDSPPTSKIAAP
jgi:hypothetical protein